MDKLANDIFDILELGGRIFKNREVLRYSYIPDTLPHREREIQNIARILITSLAGHTPSNIMIYGMTGTGKTVVSKLLMKALQEKSEMINNSIQKIFFDLDSEFLGDIISNAFSALFNVVDFDEMYGKELANILHKPVKCVYINCQQMDTQYRVMTQIANRLAPFNEDDRLPVSGLPIDEVHSRVLDKFDSSNSLILIILDEIDRLVYKSGDDILYTLTRINEELQRSKVSIIGISNNLNFLDYLDSRVRSSLGAEELVFDPYNANQLRDILDHRSEEAFYSEAIDHEVISHCAAIAAQENGDARKALDLLRVSAELAERDHSPRLSEMYVKQAQKKIETDRVSQVVRTLPLQTKLVLYSILQQKISGRMKTTTKEVVETYSFYASKLDLTVLGRRQVVNLMNELDKLGLIQTKVISFGRHGRTTVVEANVPGADIINNLHNGLLSKLKGIKPRMLYSTTF
ncbi:MAG: orc1/cdc6 family replication initiation protein [Candidatus Thermoplasmatota archaeon]|nr:orc1/cdc6 family replication initiation protein [Candidatus Thermoplasmatota archaeon]